MAGGVGGGPSEGWDTKIQEVSRSLDRTFLAQVDKRWAGRKVTGFDHLAKTFETLIARFQDFVAGKENRISLAHELRGLVTDFSKSINKIKPDSAHPEADKSVREKFNSNLTKMTTILQRISAKSPGGQEELDKLYKDIQKLSKTLTAAIKKDDANIEMGRPVEGEYAAETEALKRFEEKTAQPRREFKRVAEAGPEVLPHRVFKRPSAEAKEAIPTKPEEAKIHGQIRDWQPKGTSILTRLRNFNESRQLVIAYEASSPEDMQKASKEIVKKIYGDDEEFSSKQLHEVIKEINARIPQKDTRLKALFDGLEKATLGTKTTAQERMAAIKAREKEYEGTRFVEELAEPFEEQEVPSLTAEELAEMEQTQRGSEAYEPIEEEVTEEEAPTGFELEEESEDVTEEEVRRAVETAEEPTQKIAESQRRAQREVEKAQDLLKRRAEAEAVLREIGEEAPHVLTPAEKQVVGGKLLKQPAITADQLLAIVVHRGSVPKGGVRIAGRQFVDFMRLLSPSIPRELQGQIMQIPVKHEYSFREEDLKALVKPLRQWHGPLIEDVSGTEEASSSEELAKDVKKVIDHKQAEETKPAARSAWQALGSVFWNMMTGVRRF